MAELIYTAITSLDGYIEDEEGRFDWAVPDPEVHTFVNDLERPVGTHLYGRRMYETMAVWQVDVDELPSDDEGEWSVPRCDRPRRCGRRHVSYRHPKGAR
jgi:dihydrofolate reductase